MRAIIRFVFLTALRDRLFSGLAGMVLAIFAVSLFLGNAALTEQAQAGLVYAAGTARVIVILGLAVFIAFQTQRLFESREIEAILSRSISRGAFVVSYWLGFAAISVLLVAALAVVLTLIYGVHSAILLWCVSLLIECLLVLSFTQFTALTLERATTTIFVTFSFYGLTRLIGFFLGIRDATPSIGANRFVNPMIDGLAYVLPRVDLMTQTKWLVYGFDATDFVPLVLGQAAIFIALILSASAFDLRQKQF
jgi:hypothetical protein